MSCSRARAVIVVAALLLSLGYPSLALRAQDIATQQREFEQAKAARPALYPFCEQVQKAANNKQPIVVTKKGKTPLVTAYKQFGDATFNKAIAIATEQLQTCRKILALEQKWLQAQLNKKPEFEDTEAKLIWNDASENQQIVSTGTLTGNVHSWTFIGSGSTTHRGGEIHPNLLRCTGRQTRAADPANGNDFWAHGHATCDAAWTEGHDTIDWHCEGDGGYNVDWYVLAGRKWFAMGDDACVGFFRVNGKADAQYKFHHIGIISGMTVN